MMKSKAKSKTKTLYFPPYLGTIRVKCGEDGEIFYVYATEVVAKNVPQVEWKSHREKSYLRELKSPKEALDTLLWIGWRWL